ncbi:MAG: hypothetical protein IJP86_00675 [Synergistaceae bacterium]|nr:hypothetical protein [Synergistaceae bacterium]
MSVKRAVKNVLRKLVLLMKEREMIPIPSPVNTNTLLAGKIAFITGGSGGIGMGIARERGLTLGLADSLLHYGRERDYKPSQVEIHAIP